MTSVPALPAWQRHTVGERRWPVAVAVLVVVGVQLALPGEVVLGTRWLLPALEVAVLAVLALTRTSVEHESPHRRRLSLILTALISVANAGTATRLVLRLVEGRIEGAGSLLAAGAAIWATNVIAFSLWYWQFDRGGPAARARGGRAVPDFLFPQMQTPGLDAEWEPRYTDYLYVAYTNATAFSPTDTMPLSSWAKLTMMLQSAVSLVTIALVVARAVNVLH